MSFHFSQEKLDRVRRAAGKVIEELFFSEDESISRMVFPHNEEIRAIFAGAKDIDWSIPSHVFPFVSQLLRLSSYRRAVWEGFLQSMGCMSAGMSSVALSNVKRYLVELQNAAEKNEEGAIKQLVLLGEDIVFCCEKRFHNPLFIVPFFRAIGNLLTTGDYFSVLKKKVFCFFFFSFFFQN